MEDLRQVPLWENCRYEFKFQSTCPAMLRVTDKADRMRFMLFTREDINAMKQIMEEVV